jgi:Na+-driven multidrug efflux pump
VSYGEVVRPHFFEDPNLIIHPTVTATQVAKEAAKGDKDALQDSICQALFVGGLIALIGTPLIFFNPDKVLSVVLNADSPAMEFAKPYLLIRSFSFLFQMLSVVGFSAFRGELLGKRLI